VRFLSQRCSIYFKTGEKFGHLFLNYPQKLVSKLATKQDTKRISGSLSSWRTFIYLGTNSIVLRNVDFFSEIIFLQEKKESDGKIENISLIEKRNP